MGQQQCPSLPSPTLGRRREPPLCDERVALTHSERAFVKLSRQLSPSSAPQPGDYVSTTPPAPCPPPSRPTHIVTASPATFPSSQRPPPVSDFRSARACQRPDQYRRHVDRNAACRRPHSLAPLLIRSLYRSPKRRVISFLVDTSFASGVPRHCSAQPTGRGWPESNDGLEWSWPAREEARIAVTYC
ncbi:hypothetical protein FA95DRAFT_1558935 [Auriscalpium vulgare]|uniref:Uncharacterized protein n=1 Tax=Auriscalpium vulgare TaxID=40419 RepID=A0ACB8RU93_9AGAM|nr:hypothetical protein FA95DRAFT_1558935 [Auriscalpium vulgare]